jgi:hypothetical protein
MTLKFNTETRHWLRMGLLCATLMLVGLAGCEKHAADQGDASDGPAGVMIDAVNYRHDRGINYRVYYAGKESLQPIGGAVVYPLVSGGGKGCCINLPSIWRPGIKIVVEWEETDTERTYPEKYRKDLEVRQYTTPADLFVVFKDDHQVELVVSAAEPGHPDWPGSIKMTPWDYCLQKHERKVCKRALPKTFSMADNQGFCTYTKSADFPNENFNGDELCKSAMIECVREFEDNERCAKVLWGDFKK